METPCNMMVQHGKQRKEDISKRYSFVVTGATMNNKSILSADASDDEQYVASEVLNVIRNSD